ncbi:MAG: hypothetical protein RJB66_1791 [Pseudomonadota bacterium]|jgi:hypothetical protein
MKARHTIMAIFLGMEFLACSPKNQNPSSLKETLNYPGETAPLGESPNAIVGGEIPAPHDLVRKYTVAVVDVDTMGLCSGTIVSKRTVVTAAHCITSKYGALVLFGPNIHKPNHIISPSKVIILPGYDERRKDPRRFTKDLGDVAVIQLKEDIPTSHRVAKIAPKNMILKNGDRLLLAGYGATGDDSKSENGTLRKVNVNVLVSQWGAGEFVLNQRDGTGSCFGDSGGPAFYYKNAEYFLIGITSRAGPFFFDRCGGVSVYSHAGYYRDFITQNIVPDGSAQKQKAQ